MVAAPIECGVITPDDASMVALALLDEDHNPPTSVLSNVVVPLEQISWLPLKVPALTGKFIVTSRVAVAIQPPEPITV